MTQAAHQTRLVSHVTRVDHQPLPGMLPHPLTSLVGRDAEIATVSGWLTEGGRRLVTLTGSGGVGKTRLAIAVGASADEYFEDGVSFAPLAAIAAPDLVPPAITAALGIPVRAGQSAEQALVDALRRRHLLLVLDNFEHVLDAAPFVSGLLQQCPRLHVLVSSRSPLRISGETLARVTPLSTPSRLNPAEPLGSDATAVLLFVERAKALDARFSLSESNAETIAAICRHLDGLPLAIELAVGRLQTMSAATMLERLATHEQRLSLLTAGMRDTPDRLRTMERAIHWSYDLLLPAERRLFRILSVFTGGCAWEAIESVATETGIPPDSLPDLLSNLVAHSLVEWHDADDGSGARYTMLETVRAFGIRQLQSAGEEVDVRNAHAGWCEKFAKETEQRIYTGSDRHRTTMARARAEVPNMRSGLLWTISRNDPRRALAISGANAFAWSLIDLWKESAEWIERALAMPGADDASPNVRVRALSAIARLYVLLDQFDQAADAIRHAGELTPLVDDAYVRAFALHMRGMVRVFSGDATGGYADCLVASEEYATSGHAHDSLLAAFSAGRGEFHARRMFRARQRFLSILSALESVGHDFLRGMVLSALADLELGDGNRDRARGYLDTVAPVLTDLGDIWFLTWHIESRARIEAPEHPAWSLAILVATGAWRDQMSFPVTLDERPEHARLMERIRSDLSPAEYVAAQTLGASMSIPEAIAFAFVQPGTVRAMPGSKQVLTPREVEVLRLVVDGVSDKEIAAALAISRRTASRHVASILNKLDVGSRTAAATFAIRNRLVESPA